MKQSLFSLSMGVLCAAISISSFANDAKTNLLNPPAIKMFSSFLWAANGNMANGNRCVFDAQYSNAVDGYDAVKFMNPGENFGLKRDNYTAALGKYTTIESGQAFYVSNVSASAGSIVFKEGQKKSGSRLVNRTSNNNGFTNDDPITMLSTSLVNANGLQTDGNRVVFNDFYNNAIDEYDAIKITNPGENLGTLRNGQSLIVEARSSLTTTDTIFYNISNLQPQTYKLVVAPQNIPANDLAAELVDKFTNTRTAVSLSDTTFIDLTITADAASKVADRFMLVFKPAAGPLPVTITSVAATRNADRSIAVTWKVENEINIDNYTIERSADGRNFTGIITSAQTNSIAYTKNDISPLAADNFYRIKATSKDGQVQYSVTVKVPPVNVKASISVYPNPVVNKTMQVQFVNQPAGKYQLQLSNNLGQIVYTGVAQVAGAGYAKTVSLKDAIIKGNYQLKVISEDGSITIQQLIID